MSVDTEFYHTKFMNKAKELRDVEELYEVLDLVHANYLIQKMLFKNLAHRVSSDGYELPPLHELFTK